jgi:CRP/FNR family transcriptional regulator, anaerobic regulatory protein
MSMLREIDSPSDFVNARGIIPTLPNLPCNTCQFRSSNFCGALLGRNGLPMAVRGRHREIAARQNIYRAGEINEGVLMICEGWAVRFVQLPNGKRQILAVLLPGDLVSPTAILESQFSFSIQAVTDVRYCYFPFAEVRARIRDNPSLFDSWLRLTAVEQRDTDKRLVDLGQRTAQERIAALIVHVMQRCEQRGELVDDEFPFPLSQQQIADFTGLTPVHTCRVLSALRKRAICDVGHGLVKIRERAELQRLGSLR